MRTFTHESEFGTIEYRLPTIPEVTKMMNFFKEYQQNKDEIGAITATIENLSAYIVKVDLDVEGDKVTTWDDLMNYSEVFQDLMNISNIIVDKTFNRNTSKKKR